MTTTVGEKTDVGAPADHVLFGYLEEMASHGDGYELRFDAALMLSGETATVAAENGVIAPGEPVPNDYYRVNESPRPFTYVVPRPLG